MDYQHLSTNIKDSIEGKDIEAEIKSLWEKIRKASEIIFVVKEENQVLKFENQDLQQKYQEAKMVLASREKEIAQLRAEFARIASAGENSFSPQEKEVLKKRISDLITKINSHI